MAFFLLICGLRVDTHTHAYIHSHIQTHGESYSLDSSNFFLGQIFQQDGADKNGKRKYFTILPYFLARN